MRGAIYNEIEGFAADWLENLVNAGHIAAGKVDRRSIKDLEPADVGGPGQRHFFAGIGVWQHALRLAGVADSANVWTGSCPCQPFSAAGKRRGVDDERHLWPDWFALIRQCRPSIVFGEQVAGAAGVDWLTAVFADLESCGYAVAGADLAAASIGAPHKRQRLFWVAYTRSNRRQGVEILRRGRSKAGGRGRRGGVDDTAGARREGGAEREIGFLEPDSRRGASGVAHLHGSRLEKLSETHNKIGRDARGDVVDRRGERGRLGYTRSGGSLVPNDTQVNPALYRTSSAEGTSANLAPWDRPEWVYCDDPGGARWRPVEPGTFPLARRASNRVGRLRAYGNAIVAPLAAEFILASLEAIEDQND